MGCIRYGLPLSRQAESPLLRSGLNASKDISGAPFLGRYFCHKGNKDQQMVSFHEVKEKVGCATNNLNLEDEGTDLGQVEKVLEK